MTGIDLPHRRQISLPDELNTQTRNWAKISAARLADNPPIVPGRYDSFAVTLSAKLGSLRVDNNLSLRAMELRVMLDEPLALLPTVGLPDGTGHFLCFLVLKFHDKLPFSQDSSLRHFNVLYGTKE
ncbi:MAG: hypothetical protein JOZ60_12980 [Verrucomicrobia bacterium]|nr:hypothetical protein [Verrucomicrobiota bacterium]